MRDLFPLGAACALLALPCATCCTAQGSGAESSWSASLSLDGRHFPTSGAFAGQSSGDVSLAFEGQYDREWDDGRQSLAAEIFARVDSQDPERTHFDLSELLWRRVARSWELRAGVGKVFWGVTESQHLVDIVNQTDLVENVDGEDKLGQPMVNLALFRNWGTLELFLLPGFRERTFAGRDGRLRAQLAVDTDLTRYESGAEAWHVDWALRWRHSFGIWDLGLSLFDGTGREPILRFDETASGELAVVPLYEQITQFGLDLQATVGGWLWKLEAIRREGLEGTFSAATGGFEYTLVGTFGTTLDIGLLVEYLWDERDLEDGRTLSGGMSTADFEDDLFLGTRWVLNDVQGTEILVGALVDREDPGELWTLEASRRLRGDWKMELQVRAFRSFEDREFLSQVLDDDYVQLSIVHYF